MIQIAEALCYMHSKGVIHRDLRCVNILVSKTEIELNIKLNKKMDIKVSDFGVAFWSSNKGDISPPKFYVGGKDMYVAASDDDTVKPSFDLRY